MKSMHEGWRTTLLWSYYRPNNFCWQQALSYFSLYKAWLDFFSKQSQTGLYRPTATSCLLASTRRGTPSRTSLLIIFSGKEKQSCQSKLRFNSLPFSYEWICRQPLIWVSALYWKCSILKRSLHWDCIYSELINKILRQFEGTSPLKSFDWCKQGLRIFYHILTPVHSFDSYDMEWTSTHFRKWIGL